MLFHFQGMDWVTRIQKSLLVLLMLAQLDMFLGSVLDLEDVGSLYLVRIDTDTKGDPIPDNFGIATLHEGEGYKQIDYEQRHAFGFTGWSMDTASDNFNPQYETSPMQADPTFIDLFGVFFTAVTGNRKFVKKRLLGYQFYIKHYNSLLLNKSINFYFFRYCCWC